MKLKATLVLLIALAGGAGAFTWRAVRNGAEPAVSEPELRWLQREFALSADAVLRIAELHRRYTAECEPMCAALQASEAEMRRLMAGGRRMTPELEAALSRSNKIVAECQHRMVEHFYAVAREMPPPAGERYLALMTPIATHPEQGWMKVRP
ncbi:MAG: hypothetical protein HY736_21880 [Verrucomicrobia bacterium]|nr:hypothetical protein [Verrucomicrobiota bacterium]